MAGEARNLTENNVRVKIDNVRKVFNTRNGEMVALNGVSLDIHNNEFICVVGPSGCGKSTLLNIIAGLTEPTSGKVYCDGKEVTGTGTERGVVFQQYALFPWLTVKKNVMFALEMRGVKGKEAEEEALKYLAMVDLVKFADHYPKELSGGMKQRVAIARAYAANPEVLLMDEPFGALDAQTRTQLQTELLETWEREKKTCFFITHDVEEAIILAHERAPRPHQGYRGRQHPVSAHAGNQADPGIQRAEEPHLEPGLSGVSGGQKVKRPQADRQIPLQ